MLRVGVLGAGNHSTRNHGPALARYRSEHPDRTELAAVCDLDPEARARYADRFGFGNAYAQLDTMLESESLDAVIAVTPVDVTRDVAGRLLRTGIPLLLEKPPGRTPTEAAELARIAADHETPHAVSMNRRFNPAFDRVRSWLAARPAAQRPQYASARMCRTGRTEPGFVTNTGIHTIDAVCAVLGRPRRLTADRWRSNPDGTASGHVGVGRVGYDEAVATIELLSAVGNRAERYAFYGAGTTATVDTLNTCCTGWIDGDRVFEWSIDPDAAHEVANGTYAETAAFLEAVHGDRSFGPTLEDVTPSFVVAQAMSAGRSGRIEAGRTPEP